MSRLKLKAAASLLVENQPNQLSFSQKPPTLHKQGESDHFNLDQSHFEKEYDVNNDLQRQSSFLSYQNLSIDGRMSLCDSEYSQYNPSINEPVISVDA